MRYFYLVALALAMAACGARSAHTDAQQRRYDGPDAPTRKKSEAPRVTPDMIVFKKDLQYDKYTLEDVYPYRDTVRRFQWNKIRNGLVIIEQAQLDPAAWGVLQNRKNANGEAPLVGSWVRNAYKRVSDTLGVERYQSVPLYALTDTLTPVRYGNDGSWVRLSGDTLGSFVRVSHIYFESDWYVPRKYIKRLDSSRFDKVVAVDCTNQNITTLERTDSAWLVRSMNPATTGVHNPPYAMETPLGMFVVQEKKQKMLYTHDGSSALAGYAPWASRFSNGGYIHGVPTNDPNGSIIEYGWTLGTTPRSHMCVRNASSHAKFVYDWAEVGQSIVFVLE